MFGHFNKYRVKAAQVLEEVQQFVSRFAFNVFNNVSPETSVVSLMLNTTLKLGLFVLNGHVTIMNNDNEEHTLTKFFEFLDGKLKN